MYLGFEIFKTKENEEEVIGYGYTKEDLSYPYLVTTNSGDSYLCLSIQEVKDIIDQELFLHGYIDGELP